MSDVETQPMDDENLETQVDVEEVKDSNDSKDQSAKRRKVAFTTSHEIFDIKDDDDEENKKDDEEKPEDDDNDDDEEEEEESDESLLELTMKKMGEVLHNNIFSHTSGIPTRILSTSLGEVTISDENGGTIYVGKERKRAYHLALVPADQLDSVNEMISGDFEQMIRLKVNNQRVDSSQSPSY
jgi:hypothetical protein